MQLPFKQNLNMRIFNLLIRSFFFITFFSCVYADDATKTTPINQAKPIIFKATIHGKDSLKVTLIKKEISQTMLSIKKLIGSATCSDNKSCAAIAIGQKACGGPQNFLAYSRQNTDTDDLITLSRKHQNLSRRLNKLTRTTSDCLFLSAPVVNCRNQQCQK